MTGGTTWKGGEWRRMAMGAALLAVLLWGAAAKAESPPGKGSSPRPGGGKPSRAPVRMDSVEVQGLRARQERLHLPAPEIPAASASLPLDLFREDLGRALPRPKAAGKTPETEGSHE